MTGRPTRGADRRRRRRQALQARLDGADQLEAIFENGELSLRADGAPVLNRIYLNDGFGSVAQAYWRWLLLSRSWPDAKRLAAELRRPPAEFTSPTATQFMTRVDELAEVVDTIASAERAMNARLFDLYDLSDEERLLADNHGKGRGGSANHP